MWLYGSTNTYIQSYTQEQHKTFSIHAIYHIITYRALFIGFEAGENARVDVLSTNCIVTSLYGETRKIIIFSFWYFGV